MFLLLRPSNESVLLGVTSSKPAYTRQNIWWIGQAGLLDGGSNRLARPVRKPADLANHSENISIDLDSITALDY